MFSAISLVSRSEVKYLVIDWKIGELFLNPLSAAVSIFMINGRFSFVNEYKMAFIFLASWHKSVLIIKVQIVSLIWKIFYYTIKRAISRI